MDDSDVLLDPAPLPQPLVDAALVVAENLGLPEGIVKRLTWKTYGKKLRIGFIHRFDQINFKLYASVDQRGGYHADDL